MTDRELKDKLADALAFIISDYKDSREKGDFENGTLRGAHWMMSNAFGLDFGLTKNGFVIYDDKDRHNNAKYEIVDGSEAKLIENRKKHMKESSKRTFVLEGMLHDVDVEVSKITPMIMDDNFDIDYPDASKDINDFEERLKGKGILPFETLNDILEKYGFVLDYCQFISSNDESSAVFTCYDEDSTAFGKVNVIQVFFDYYDVYMGVKD